ncbi:hypothetical protein A3709_19350 [Halioglobus sp. HI00S01]|uniref:hypothetical protein n=1 Tax=Halioglobus sp. HI00S01 TaxID=1822214 RepID=UPI0007C33CCB|nr:hypothetical protein [Halioglobus sp. HI00S01]KZX57781.1 hypothetical protein A3709_19350 [Halioglobus sp. HI00S01]
MQTFSFYLFLAVTATWFGPHIVGCAKAVRSGSPYLMFTKSPSWGWFLFSVFMMYTVLSRGYMVLLAPYNIYNIVGLSVAASVLLFCAVHFAIYYDEYDAATNPEQGPLLDKRPEK